MDKTKSMEIPAGFDPETEFLFVDPDTPVKKSPPKKDPLKIIKDTTKFEKNIELVRDDSYNAKIFQKIIVVEEKIDQLDLIFT